MYIYFNYYYYRNTDKDIEDTGTVTSTNLLPEDIIGIAIGKPASIKPKTKEIVIFAFTNMVQVSLDWYAVTVCIYLCSVCMYILWI